MCDLIHFDIRTNITIIFEGETNQCKQTVIKYISDLLGLYIFFNLINIYF